MLRCCCRHSEWQQYGLLTWPLFPSSSSVAVRMVMTAPTSLFSATTASYDAAENRGAQSFTSITYRSTPNVTDRGLRTFFGKDIDVLPESYMYIYVMSISPLLKQTDHHLIIPRSQVEQKMRINDITLVHAPHR